MKRIAIAFTGPSNSGKTTLIVNISEMLKKYDYKVAIIKHDAEDKATFDVEGKDSYKFSKTGADVAVISPKKTTLMKKSSSSVEDIIKMFDDFDYLLVEGFKKFPLPRIAVFREKLDEKYFEVTDAIATDDTIKKEMIPSGYPHLNLNNTKSIIEWIDKYGEKIPYKTLSIFERN